MFKHYILSIPSLQVPDVAKFTTILLIVKLIAMSNEFIPTIKDDIGNKEKKKIENKKRNK